MYSVVVECEWNTTDAFEFETFEEAQEFWDRVSKGDLSALVAAGDVTSEHASLTDWGVISKRPAAPAGEEGK